KHQVAIADAYMADMERAIIERSKEDIKHLLRQTRGAKRDLDFEGRKALTEKEKLFADRKSYAEYEREKDIPVKPVEKVIEPEAEGPKGIGVFFKVPGAPRQKFEMIRNLPREEADLSTERYYEVKDIKTGELQTVEELDLKPIDEAAEEYLTQPKFAKTIAPSKAKSTIAQIKTYMQKALGEAKANNLIDTGKVVIVENETGLPGQAEAADVKKFDEGAVFGMSLKGTIYLVAGSLNAKDVYPILLHESLHAEIDINGWQGFFGDRYDIIMNQYDRLIQESDPGLLEAQEMAERAGTPKEHVFEETLAYYITNEANHNTSLFRKILNAVRAWAVRNGFLREINAGDLVPLAQAALRRQMKATPKDKGRIAESDVRYARDIASTFQGTKTRVEQIAETYNLKERFEKLTTYLIDKDAPIARVQKEIPKQPESRNYNLFMRLMGKAITDETKVFDENVRQPLVQFIADNGLSLQDVEELAYAQHVPERNIQMKRVNARRYVDEVLSKMTKTEAQKWKNKIIDIGDELFGDTQGKRDKYIQMMQDLRDSLVERAKNTKGNVEKRIATQKDILSKWEDRKDRLSGTTDIQAQKTINEWKKKDNYKANQEAVDRLVKIGNDTLDMSYKAGEITQGEYDAMQAVYKHHVPLYREDMDFSKASTGRRVGPLAKPHKLAAGSDKRVIDIFAHIIDKYQSGINRKHKLEGQRILYDMVKANPDEDKWSVVKQNKIPYHDYEGNLRLYEDREEDPNEVYVKIDGVRHLIQVPRGNESMQRWMDAIKRVPTELGPVLKASRKLNKFLAQLNTSLSPEFLLTNFPRDLQTAMIHLENLDQAKLRGAIIKDIPKTIKGIYVAETGKDAGEIGQWYEEFSKYGGKISWMQGYEDVQELAKNLETDLAYAKGKHPRKAQFKKVLSYVEAMNVAV
ncbi:MAG: hypothetical protein KAJ10_08745, partial [Thermodesulfovibrionia bacterium]|nr:hypothetical protein [Thermodesulfovibrionia bacterium]